MSKKSFLLCLISIVSVSAVHGMGRLSVQLIKQAQVVMHSRGHYTQTQEWADLVRTSGDPKLKTFFESKENQLKEAAHDAKQLNAPVEAIERMVTSLESRNDWVGHKGLTEVHLRALGISPETELSDTVQKVAPKQVPTRHQSTVPFKR